MTATHDSTQTLDPRILHLLFFFSGFVLLSGQVLWQYKLKLLFGNLHLINTAILLGTFLGIGIGAYLWNKVAHRIQSISRSYALITCIMGVTLWLTLPPIQTKNIAVASFILFAVASGGVYPLLGALVPNKSTRFPKKLSHYYGIETLGGATGIIATIFITPSVIGYNITTLLYGGIVVILGLTAYYIPQKHHKIFSQPLKTKIPMNLNPAVITTIFASGFLFISLELVWTLVIAQILPNDTYSFGMVLLSFIIAMASAAFVVSNLDFFGNSHKYKLFLILEIAAGIVIITTLLLYNITQNPQTILASPFLLLIILVVGSCLMATVYPYILTFLPINNVPLTLQHWVIWNSLGASCGIVFSFFMVLSIGAWKTAMVLALGYALIGAYIHHNKRTIRISSIMISTLVLCLVSFPPQHTTDTIDHILRRYEDHSGIYTVTETDVPYHTVTNGKNRVITYNRHYTIGGVGGYPDEQRQTHIPLWTVESPSSIAYIGMGTGITAGAALYYPIQHIDVMEINPVIATLAEEYFQETTNDLFNDPRVSVHVTDGRTYLANTHQTYDVIIADLFNPRLSGINAVYTKEHFEVVKNRLTENGVFMQWLPVWEINAEEFSIVAGTMSDVFPSVTLWWGNFSPDKPVLGLLGSTETILNPATIATSLKNLEDKPEVLTDLLIHTRGNYPPLSPQAIATEQQLAQTLQDKLPLTFYAGNISSAQKLFSSTPINTYDKPVFEHSTAQSLHTPKLSGQTLSAFLINLRQLTPPDNDPFLKLLNTDQYKFSRAGVAYYQFQLYESLENSDKAQVFFRQYRELLDL